MEIVVALLTGAVAFLFVVHIGLSLRVLSLEKLQTKGLTATATALNELLKGLLQLNLKVEAAKTQADETYFKKTDVA